MCLDALHHFEIQKSKYLAVSTTKEIASSLLHAVISCSHADSAMIKSVIIQWIGITLIST